MMIHLEGPVVDSIYDVLLLSWHKTFNPPLPCLGSPSPNASKSFEYTFSDLNIYLQKIELIKAANAARRFLGKNHQAVLDAPSNTPLGDEERKDTPRLAHLVWNMMRGEGANAGSATGGGEEEKKVEGSAPPISAEASPVSAEAGAGEAPLGKFDLICDSFSETNPASVLYRTASFPSGTLHHRQRQTQGALSVTQCWSENSSGSNNI